MQNPKMSAASAQTDFQKRRALVEERLQADSSEVERKLLVAAEVGDKDVVIEVVESGDVSVEVVNLSGRTPLEIAVDGNSIGIVEYLLPKCSRPIIHQSLLCAVENDRNVIFDLILKHPMYQVNMSGIDSDKDSDLDADFNGGELEDFEAGGADTFPKDPMVLLRDALVEAAMESNFTIVRTLVLHGAFIKAPHLYFCICTRCTKQKRDDMMQYTKERLSTYKALASPAYVAITEKDPIVGAFKLSYQFRKLSDIEVEYKQTYLELDEQCQQFAIGLIDQCRSSVEVSHVLSGKVRGLKGNLDSDGEDSEDEDEILPVLKLAMRLEQKRFVAHTSCQAQVSQLWSGGWSALRYLNRFGYLCAAIPAGMVVIPVMSLIFIVYPWGKIGKVLESPIMRFVSFTCSYISFLVFVMVSKLNYGMTMDMIGCDMINPVQQGLFGFLIVWLLSLMWQESLQIFEAGGKEYFLSFWNVMDTIMLSLYMCTFSLELIGPRVLQNLYNREYGDRGEPAYCEHLRQEEDMCNHQYKDQIHEIFWEPRWLPDPSLLSDMTFSIAILMSISRFSFIMPSNEQSGTMLVSFQRTAIDIFKLCSMFILVLFAFSFGMTVLYGAEACNNPQFNGLIETMRTLVWSMMGMGDSASTDIDAPENPSFPLRPTIISNTGAIFFMIFVFATAVVLMNLLIAMMADTFQGIQDERETEWKFGRTELWLNFMEPGSVIYPPFNIIPSARSILDACVTLQSKMGPSKDPVHILKSSPDNKRPEILSKLVRRYVRKEERERLEDEEDSNKDDILRKTLDRVTTKLEKRLDHVDAEIALIAQDLHNVIERQNSMTEELQRVV